MNPRPPFSFSGAVSQVIALLGVTRAAAAIGLSESLVYKAQQQSSPYMFSLYHAALLDMEMVRAGYEPPFTAVFEERVSRVGQPPHRPRKFANRLVEITGRLGLLARAVGEVTPPGGGQVVSVADLAAIRRYSLELRYALDDFDRDLEQAA